MDAQYAYLKEHDAEWLAETLEARSRHIQRENEQAQHPPPTPTLAVDHGILLSSCQHHISHGATASAGPHDVTAADLSSDHVLSDHIRLVRAHDWAATEMGAMVTWSTELRRMVNVCLRDRNKAAVLWWGPRRIAIYNEAYAQVVARRHPAALGQPVDQVWPELVDLPFGRSFDHADATGEPSGEERVPFYVDRAGYVEEIWASW